MSHDDHAIAEPPAAHTGIMLGWLTLVVLLIVCVPLFVCMPLNNDVVLYDMQARNVLNGGVLYRDILETNLPGIVWIHLLVRSIVGWSSEALRCVDLALFSLTVWLATRWLKSVGLSPTIRIWSANALFLFYFSIIEWNHCQRDIWMLLPALAALHLRRRQTERLMSHAPVSLAIVCGWAMLEAACWSAAVWVKPHVVIPAAGAWVASVLVTRRWRYVAADFATLLITGGLLGGAGVAWLKATGAWPHFLDVMTNWNPHYFRAGKEHWEWKRLLGLFARSCPWHFLQPIAVIVAALQLVSAAKQGREPSPTPSASFRQTTVAEILLAVFFLLWLGQVLLLQHQFDYVYVPPLILGLIVLIAAMAQRPSPMKRGLAISFAILALVCSPLLKFDRLAAWSACVSEGSTPPVRDRVKLENIPFFVQEQEVVEFLREQKVQDHEVMFFHDRLIPLYFDMQLQPPTRFVYAEQIMAFFANAKDPANDRRRLLYDGLKAAPLRFVVVDLSSARTFKTDEALAPGDDVFSPPPSLDIGVKELFPWSHPIVFRAGPYLVYKVTEPLGRLRWDAPKKKP